MHDGISLISELRSPLLSPCSCVNNQNLRLCASCRSQGHLAVPALWPWHPKMLCPLPWPSPSPLMPTSKELIPQSESHMMPLPLKGPDADRHARTYLSIFELDPAITTRRREPPRHFCAAGGGSPSSSLLGALQVECFALAWHHSFRVDNLGEVDYSLGQRKHTGFYWPTAA